MKQQKVSDKVKDSLSPVVAKHTPGPWIDHNSNKVLAIYGNGNELIASLGEPTKQDIVNARLIASAPDLLDALKAIQERVRTGITELTDTELALMGSAIAKAEGRE